MVTATEIAALRALLVTPPVSERVTPADDRVAPYDLWWHVTRKGSRSSANAALRAAGFEYVRGVRSSGVTFYRPGYWKRGNRVADVRGVGGSCSYVGTGAVELWVTAKV